MSIPHLNAAWTARIADPQAKLVLVRLADRADKTTGLCWPSLSDLVADTELHRSTICRKIELLETLGWITRNRLKNGVEYTVNLEPNPSQGATILVRQPVAPCDPFKGGTSRTELPLENSNQSHTATQPVAPCDLPILENPKEPTRREKSAHTLASSPSANQEHGDWSDRMPTEAAKDFDKLEAWINSLHPKWKQRPHFSRVEREELMANSKIFFDLIDKDKALLAAYLDAAIPEEWGKFWQPDQRGQIVRSVMDVLGHADRWERECRKRKLPTGIETVTAGGVA